MPQSCSQWCASPSSSPLSTPWLQSEGVDIKGVTNVMEEMSRRNRELFELPPYAASPPLPSLRERQPRCAPLPSQAPATATLRAPPKQPRGTHAPPPACTHLIALLRRVLLAVVAVGRYVLYVARAFSTLEGIGLSVDEDYAIVQVMMPPLTPTHTGHTCHGAASRKPFLTARHTLFSWRGSAPSHSGVTPPLRILLCRSATRTSRAASSRTARRAPRRRCAPCSASRPSTLTASSSPPPSARRRSRSRRLER